MRTYIAKKSINWDYSVRFKMFCVGYMDTYMKNNDDDGDDDAMPLRLKTKPVCEHV